MDIEHSIHHIESKSSLPDEMTEEANTHLGTIGAVLDLWISGETNAIIIYFLPLVI
jgi:hypothetical protein